MSLLEPDFDFEANTISDLQSVQLIKAELPSLPSSPGIYRMLDRQGNVLYIGKARDLRRRLAYYTRLDNLPSRIMRMVMQVRRLEIVITTSEVQALLLESNEIKRLKPRYNILLRDNKSFPYLLITGHHPFPSIEKHRGAQTRRGRYFGPFAAIKAVNRAVITLQKAFLLRNCSDHVFSHRNRPCLQYHIKRCCAPCVGLIDHDSYKRLVTEAESFLSGKSHDLIKKLTEEMHSASDNLDFERAARLRDRIRSLSCLITSQAASPEGLGDADVIAIHRAEDSVAIAITFVRAGQSFGTRSFFPIHAADRTSEDILGAFLAQFYRSGRPIPPLLLIDQKPTDADLLTEALSQHRVGRLCLSYPKRGVKKNLLDYTRQNAADALNRKRTLEVNQKAIMHRLATLIGVSIQPERIEVYDNSHLRGTHAYGVMIVANSEGFERTSYRRFSIKSLNSEDDPHMMHEVLMRRFGHAHPDKPDGCRRPGLIIIDGGKGQLHAAYQALKTCGVGDIPLIAIAKGRTHADKTERIYQLDHRMITLSSNNPVLHFVQRLRDEAHRFAIGTHRSSRIRRIKDSPLDRIAGVGVRRKRAILERFHSVRAAAEASAEDLARIPGISLDLAQRIRDALRAD